MKTKKGFEKKLVFKRRTIANLEDRELGKVVGGSRVGCITLQQPTCFCTYTPAPYTYCGAACGS